MLKLPLVIALAAASLIAQVPSPKTHFGHDVTEDRKLLDWEKVVSYFRALERASPKIKIVEYGKSTLGRPLIAAILAPPDTLTNTARYQEITRKLADPRQIAPIQVDSLVREGKPVVIITCSIHSTEVASTHTAVEFAYRMLTQDSPRLRAISDNVILILVPSLNPDGVDIVTQWYRKTLNTPWEGTAPPELYHHYTGHDNNRDWYVFSQKETQAAIAALHNAWRPQIVYDVHQQQANGSRITLQPWLDPIEPNVDPLLVQMMNYFGTGIALDLSASGKKGISVNASYDFWTPARAYQSFHHGLRLLSESASARLATPITIEPNHLRASLGYHAGVRSWNHIEPWEGGEWHLKDIIDYQMSAFESVAYQAAIRRDDLLRNFHRIAKNQVDRKTPHSFHIPATQRDPGATRRLIELLAFGLVEVEVEGDGSHTVRMNQPYSGWAKALLEKQTYPDLRQYPGGPPQRPYDVTAHTLPLLFGVEVNTVTAPRAVSSSSIAAVQPAGRRRYSASDTDAWAVINQSWRRGGEVWRDAASGDFSTQNLGPGWRLIKRPRIGLYRSHQPVMDEGWTRWMLDQFSWAYTRASNADILAGSLKQKYDVLVFPDQTAASIRDGYAAAAMPPEFTGGLGDKGAAALKEFAAAGGTLVFLNHSADYATESLGVRAKSVTRGLSPSDFYCPGSLLSTNLDTAHPLAKGLEADLPIWMEGSPAWEPADPEIKTVARYRDASLLASGWLLGEKTIARKAALLDAPIGRGRAILFGMRPQYRAQSYLTLKLLFNALLL